MNSPVRHKGLTQTRRAARPSRWSRKAAKFAAGARAALVIAAVLYMATGVGGYAAFGTDASPVRRIAR